MSFTEDQTLRLLEGETTAAEALITTLKAAIVHKAILREDIQKECLQLIECWFALREQRIQVKNGVEPAHLFN